MSAPNSANNVFTLFTSDEADSNVWDAPRPLRGKAYMEFPVRRLPPVIRDFVLDRAEALEVDPMMIAPACFTVLSTAMGAGQIIMGDDWHEPGAVWALVAANPASRKTAAFKAATAPLLAVEDALITADAATRRAGLARIAIAEKKLKRAEGDLEQVILHDGEGPAPKLSEADAEQAVNDAAAELAHVREDVGHAPMLDVGGFSTSEALHDLLMAHGNLGMLVAEGDTLFKGLSNSGPNGLSRSIFLSSWSQEDHTRRLVSRVVGTARHPNLNLCIVVQLNIVLRAAAGERGRDQSDLTDTGFFDRFLTFVPFTGQVYTAKSKSINNLRRGEQRVSPAVQAWNDLITRWVNRTIHRKGEIENWYLAPDAEQIANEQYDDWSLRRSAYSTSSEGALGKTNGQAARLARIFEGADPKPIQGGMEQTISAENLERGWDIANFCFKQHEHLYGDAAAEDLKSIELCDKVLKKIRELQDSGKLRGNTFTKSALTRNGLGRHADQLPEALKALTEAGWMKFIDGKKWEAHPSLGYWISQYEKQPVQEN